MKRFRTIVAFGLGLAAAAAAQQPAIELEFYGYAINGGAAPQLAFLRQGERIIIAAEGDLFEDAYRLIRIGADSVVIEHNSDRRRQTLALKAPKAENDFSSAEPAQSAVQPGSSGNRRRSARPMLSQQQ